MKTLLLLLLLKLLSTTATPTDQITSEDLTTRKPTELIIEYCEGIKLDEEGNGILINTSEDYYNYISYSNIDAEVNDLIITYFVYNPFNQYEDDYIYRVDVAPDGDIFIN